MASNNGHHRNGTGNGLVHTPPRAGYGVNGNGHRPEAATVSEHDPASSAGQALLWDGLPPAVTGALGAAPRTRPGLPAQGTRRAHLLVHRGPRRHLRGQPRVRLRRMGLRAGRRRDAARVRQLRSTHRRGEAHPRLQRTGAGHRPRRPAAHRRWLPRGDGGDRRRTRDGPQGSGDGRTEARAPQLRRPLRQWPLRGPAAGQCRAASRARARAGPTHATTGDGPPPPGATRGAHRVRECRATTTTGTTQRYLRRRLIELGATQGFDEEQVRIAVTERLGKSLDELTAEELTPLVESATEKAQRMPSNHRRLSRHSGNTEPDGTAPFSGRSRFPFTGTHERRIAT